MVFVYVTLKHLEKLRKNKIALVSFLSIKADYFGGGEYKLELYMKFVTSIFNSSLVKI